MDRSYRYLMTDQVFDSKSWLRILVAFAIALGTLILYFGALYLFRKDLARYDLSLVIFLLMTLLVVFLALFYLPSLALEHLFRNPEAILLRASKDFKHLSYQVGPSIINFANNDLKLLLDTGDSLKIGTPNGQIITLKKILHPANFRTAFHPHYLKRGGRLSSNIVIIKFEFDSNSLSFLLTKSPLHW